MGAIGRGPFENDAALEWLEIAVGADLDAAAREALGAAIGGGYLGVDEGSVAVAAAALLAAALEDAPNAVPRSAREALGAWMPNEELPSLAIRALDAVSGPSSELASLWSGDEGWRSGIERLSQRLQRPKENVRASGRPRESRVDAERSKPRKRAKIRLKVGDLFEVPLGDGRFGFGHILRANFVGFYAVESRERMPIDEIIKQPVAFRIVCLTDMIENGTWPILGNVTPPAPMNATMRVWRTDALGKRFGYEWRADGATEEVAVNREFVRGIEKKKIWDSRTVPRRLNAFLRGEVFPGIEIG